MDQSRPDAQHLSASEDLADLDRTWQYYCSTVDHIQSMANSLAVIAEGYIGIKCSVFIVSEHASKLRLANRIVKGLTDRAIRLYSVPGDRLSIDTEKMLAEVACLSGRLRGCVNQYHDPVASYFERDVGDLSQQAEQIVKAFVPSLLWDWLSQTYGCGKAQAITANKYADSLIRTLDLRESTPSQNAQGGIDFKLPVYSRATSSGRVYGDRAVEDISLILCGLLVIAHFEGFESTHKALSDLLNKTIHDKEDRGDAPFAFLPTLSVLYLDIPSTLQLGEVRVRATANQVVFSLTQRMAQAFMVFIQQHASEA